MLRYEYLLLDILQETFWSLHENTTVTFVAFDVDFSVVFAADLIDFTSGSYPRDVIAVASRLFAKIEEFLVLLFILDWLCRPRCDENEVR